MLIKVNRRVYLLVPIVEANMMMAYYGEKKIFFLLLFIYIIPEVRCFESSCAKTAVQHN